MGWGGCQPTAVPSGGARGLPLSRDPQPGSLGASSAVEADVQKTFTLFGNQKSQ